MFGTSGFCTMAAPRCAAKLDPFSWIAPGWRAWGCNPRKGRDPILPPGNTSCSRRRRRRWRKIEIDRFAKVTADRTHLPPHPYDLGIRVLLRDGSTKQGGIRSDCWVGLTLNLEVLPSGGFLFLIGLMAELLGKMVTHHMHLSKFAQPTYLSRWCSLYRTATLAVARSNKL